MPENRIYKTRASYNLNDPIVRCPECGSTKIIGIYKPEIYEFDYKCIPCEKGFNICQPQKN